MKRLPPSASRFVSAFGVLAATIAPLTGCATQQRTDPVNDPWEGYNRGVFSFNEKADKYVLKPVAKGYTYVVPRYGRERVHNVITNLHMPVVFVNSVLQGDGQNAMSAAWSFILNSTFGVLGIFDFAGANTGLRVHDEDFGQTLGVWGVGPGPYFVLPILGPSTLRDTAGLPVDYFDDPYNYLVDDTWIYTRVVVRAIDARAGLLQPIDDIYATSFDPYSTFRSGYLQRRSALIANREGGQDVSLGTNGGKARNAVSDVDPAVEAESDGSLK